MWLLSDDENLKQLWSDLRYNKILNMRKALVNTSYFFAGLGTVNLLSYSYLKDY